MNNTNLGVQSQVVEIVNKLGLHARAAAKLSKLAGSFSNCDVMLRCGDKTINAKSIMGVLCLAAGKGKKIEIIVSGDGAEQALQALVALVADRFGEGE